MTEHKPKPKKSPKTSPPPPNLMQRIVAVRAEVGRISRTAEVRGAGGSYLAVSHDDVTELLRPLMVEHGIFHHMVPEHILVEQTDQRTQGGWPILRLSQRFTVFYYNADDPEEEPLPQIIDAWVNDFQDKGPGKLQSYAMKTALLKMFMVSTGENEEQTTPEQTRLARIGDDERMSNDLVALATELFGDARAHKVLKSLALRRFKIEDGDWTMIPMHRMKEAVDSLRDKADQEPPPPDPDPAPEDAGAPDATD